MVLLSPTIQGLQFLIDEIYLDFNRLGLEVNTNKTVFMVFSNDKMVNGKSFKFHFDNILLKRVFNFKYLGIILNYNLNDSLDIERSTGSFNRSFVFYSENLILCLSKYFTNCSLFIASRFMAPNFGLTDLNVNLFLIKPLCLIIMLLRKF